MFEAQIKRTPHDTDSHINNMTNNLPLTEWISLLSIVVLTPSCRLWETHIALRRLNISDKHIKPNQLPSVSVILKGQTTNAKTILNSPDFFLIFSLGKLKRSYFVYNLNFLRPCDDGCCVILHTLQTMPLKQ